MIQTSSGNLLTAPAQALVNTVNTEGVMGKGIALQFKNAYPAMYKAYVEACNSDRVHLGTMDVHDLGSIGDGPRWIINFPTKGHWKARSKIDSIKTGLDDLVHTVQRLGITSIAVPPLGCGNGGLDWDDVRPLIMRAFESLPEVRVLLFAPGATPAPAEMINRTAKPALTKSTATLILLMHRYLGGLLDPFVTLLEVHKLMYFMQEAGQDLRLNYQAEKYGPYAVNLSHVLKRLEGHYIAGSGDGTNNPEKPLELMPNAIDEAYAVLARDDDTMKRVDRVAALLEGYEDPYGLELLSTLHWVMVKNEKARKSPADAIREVHGWSARKQRLMKSAHLEKAWERLAVQEWNFDARSISASAPPVVEAPTV